VKRPFQDIKLEATVFLKKIFSHFLSGIASPWGGQCRSRLIVFSIGQGIPVLFIFQGALNQIAINILWQEQFD
jgi:hypothetical protein